MHLLEAIYHCIMCWQLLYFARTVCQLCYDVWRDCVVEPLLETKRQVTMWSASLHKLPCEVLRRISSILRQRLIRAFLALPVWVVDTCLTLFVWARWFRYGAKNLPTAQSAKVIADMHSHRFCF